MTIKLGAFLLSLAMSLPNAAITPGKVDPTISVARVCATRWGLDRRHVTLAMRRQVFESYHVPLSEARRYEVDHLVPRELGGADAIENLWPQPWPEAHVKDHAENAAHRAVCAAPVAMRAALLRQYQTQFTVDWRKSLR